MVGNVWEFVNDTAAPSAEALRYFQDKLKPAPTAAEPWYWTRGEAFDYGKLDDHAVWDGALAPARWRAADLGFRCVRDVQ
jgi:formylglycine-generating enzyme required for sulfatase activity